MLSKFPWSSLTEKCPVRYVDNPQDFVEFSHSHMVFFSKTTKYANVLCPDNDQFKTASPLVMKGAGVFTIPTHCKVKIDDRETFAMGHIHRSPDIQLGLRKDFYNLNLNLTKTQGRKCG